MSEPRPCKRCGMKIEMIEGPNGKAIPAQRVRVVYDRVKTESGETLVKLDFGGAEMALYVSHFETCPNAKDFSKGRHRADRS